MAITGRTATVAESASTQTVTGTLPTDRVTGDYVIATFHFSSTTATFTGPGGSWTTIVAPVSNGVSQLVAVYGQFDPASAPVGTTSSVAGRQTCLCQAYGGVDATTPVDVTAVTSVGVSPLTVTQVTTATNGARLLSGATTNASTGSWTQPSGMTLVKTHTSGVGRGGALADEDRPTAGATGTRVWTWSAAGAETVGYLTALRPSVGGTAFTSTITDSVGLTDSAIGQPSGSWAYGWEVVFR